MKKVDWKNIGNEFWRLPVVKEILDWSKINSFPGFEGIPIYDVTVFIINEIQRFDLVTRANSIAYSFFLALFPAIMVVFTLIPFFSDYILSFFDMDTNNFLQIIENQIINVLPGEGGIGSQLYQTIEDLATRPRTGLLTTGFILAIFFASNGMISMMRSFEKAHVSGFKKRGYVMTYLIAFLLTSQLSLLVIGSSTLIFLGEKTIVWMAGYHSFDMVTTAGIFLLRWLTIIGLVYFAIGVLYRFGAALPRKLPIFSPGTAVATILCILASLVFSYYVSNYANYNRFYGSIGAIIIIMLWIQLNAMALLIGFELNASIAVNRDLKEKREEEL